MDEYSLSNDTRNNRNKKNKKKGKASKIKTETILDIMIAMVVVAIIICIVIIFNNLKNNKQNSIEEQAVSENTSISIDEVAEEDSAFDSLEADDEPEPAEPIYRDLTLEEAWPIAQERNQTMTVTSGNVNVRERPTTESNKVGMVKENSVVYVICEEDTGDGYTWCYVIYDKAASGTTTDSAGNTVFTLENKHYLGYIRKDLLQ